jgi:hypothetical protein
MLRTFPICILPFFQLCYFLISSFFLAVRRVEPPIMASLPRGIQHVDRNALYTNLGARVAYLKDFIEFGEGISIYTPITIITMNAYSLPDDLSALERGQDLVRMVIPDIVNSVYKKLLKHDVTARVFTTHDSRDDEDPPVWPQDGSPAIQNRKIFLRWYLTRLNQDPSKKEFVRICLVIIYVAPLTNNAKWEYLDKVGCVVPDT